MDGSVPTTYPIPILTDPTLSQASLHR